MIELENHAKGFMQSWFRVTYGQNRWWQTGPDVDKLLKHWRFPGRGRGRVPFTERISPTFNLTLLLLQALDVAYRASHYRRFTELLRTIWHTTPVNRLLSTARPSWVGQWHLHTDEVSQEGLVFTTTTAAVFLQQKFNWKVLQQMSWSIIWFWAVRIINSEAYMED